MSTSDTENSEYIPDFDSVDFSQFTFEAEPTYMPGRSYEVGIINKSDDSNTLQIALPRVTITDDLDITDGGVNGFFRTQLDLSEPAHLEFKNFTENLDNWIMESIVKYHKTWFGNLWENNGPFENQPYPSANIIRNMYHPLIDDEDVFCSRVHIHKDKYKLQTMDEEQNIISLDDIQNCDVVPLVEIKGVFFKPKGFNVDCVLRGLVKLSEETENTDHLEYSLFHVDDDEEDAEYFDYATEDDTNSEVSMLEDVEKDVLAEFKNIDETIKQDEEQDVEQSVGQDEEPQFKIDDEKLKELMVAAESAKNAAELAQKEYNQYRTTVNP